MHFLVDHIANESQSFRSPSITSGFDKIYDEKESQKAFEAFKQDTENSIKARQDGIINKTEEKVQADLDLSFSLVVLSFS